jgi:hypothetical protein
VFRDGRDAFMSFVNHIASFRDDVRERLNAAAGGEGLETMPKYDGDLHGLYARWIDLPLPLVMLRGWWERRHCPTCCSCTSTISRPTSTARCGGSPRSSASRSIRALADQVARCTFEAMKRRAAEIGAFERNFVGGGESFLHKGTNGRWRDVLTDDELARYRRRGREDSSPRAGGAGSSTAASRRARPEAALAGRLSIVSPRERTRSGSRSLGSRADRSMHVSAVRCSDGRTRRGTPRLTSAARPVIIERVPAARAFRSVILNVAAAGTHAKNWASTATSTTRAVSRVFSCRSAWYHDVYVPALAERHGSGTATQCSHGQAETARATSTSGRVTPPGSRRRA